MLFQSATSTVSEIGVVSSNAFSSISPYLYLVIGLVLAFFILEMLIDIIATSKSDKKLYDRIDSITAETQRLTGR